MWFLLLSAAATDPGCVDDSGKKVDFIYGFKYNQGYDYATMEKSGKLTKSSTTMEKMDSFVSKTLAQAYDKSNSRVFYNDEHPDGKTVGKPHAHAKGVLVAGSSGGFWMQHSLPAFPNTDWDASAMWDSKEGKDHSRYGQNFLCITLDADGIKSVSEALAMYWTVTYEVTMTSEGSKKFPEMEAFATEKKAPAADQETFDLTSKGGQAFTLFAKAGKEDDDLYDNFVAVKLGPLLMEGWRNGSGGVKGPQCTVSKGKSDQVLDVMSVKFPDATWTVSHDHSKWAVTQDKKTFCACGMNRFTSQEPRGGGCACIKSSAIAGAMADVVDTTDHCKSDALIV